MKPNKERDPWIAVTWVLIILAVGLAVGPFLVPMVLKAFNP